MSGLTTSKVLLSLIEASMDSKFVYIEGRGSITSPEFDKYKFAELLIRECASQVDIKSKHRIFNFFNMTP